MKIKVISPLIKVFNDEEPITKEYSYFSLLKNERRSFQVAVFSEIDSDFNVQVSGMDNSYLKMYKVDNVPVGKTVPGNYDDFYLRTEPGMFPDILRPISDKVHCNKDEWISIWFEIVPNSEISGNFELSITIGDNNVKTNINVIDALLDKQTLNYTTWYHSDCLCDYYNVAAMSDDYWTVNRNFIKAAADHGQNTILTPLFTPALDTYVGGERTTVQLVGVKIRGGKYSFDFRNLKKWVDLCHECGIEKFEMSHLFTQWGAEHAPKIIATDRKGRTKKIFGWETRTSSKKYDDFLRQFSVQLKKFIYAEGLENNVYFHISDEPSVNHLKTYKKRAQLVKSIFGEFPFIDALSDFDFYKMGTVDIPVPAEDHLEKFVGNVPELWTYYCCGHGFKYIPNRLIAMPLLRTRIIGVLMYKYNVKGFLQWGYNFYNSQYSYSHINPFEVTDAGNAFPAGDAFIVYPGVNMSPLYSLRLKAFYDGILDYTGLMQAEKIVGRNKILEIIGDITFFEYPHEDDYLLNLQEKINSILGKI